MPFALLALAACLAAAAVLGPLGLGAIDWRVSENLLNQTYGADGATFALLMPAALIAAWAWWRGHRFAAPLSFGIGLASIYYAIASVLGANYTSFAGNNERFFLLFLAIIVLSWTIAARAWTAMDAQPPEPARRLVQGTAVVLVLGGLAISFAWLSQLLQIALDGSMADAGQAGEYVDAPSAFWVVRIVDLGFIVPLALWTGVGLWRRSGAALKASYGIAAFLTLEASEVLAMGAVMQLRNDPAASPGLILVLTPISLALGALTLALLRSYANDKSVREARVGTGITARPAAV